ncbi:PHD finger protein 24 [Stigmatopora argus]
MGALTSKKQQVNKAQRCTAVVSAFQSGIKERPGGTKPEEGPAPGSGPVPPEPAQASVPPREESGPEGGEGGQTERRAAAPSSVNREAWARLRDGKGVEPEELEKRRALTPPAYVRPKREADDDQPLGVELDGKEQPASDDTCDVCQVWTADDLRPCRICTRVFHDGCLRELGCPHAEASPDVAGWSCYYCDNVNLLLTEEEMYSLMETFKQCKIIPESCLVSDELLQYHHFVSKRRFETDLSDEQEEGVLAQFAALDPQKKGRVEWADFLYFESLAVLKRFRSQNSLVRLLSAKERDAARSAFLSVDSDRDGRVTPAERRRAQRSWFERLGKGPTQSCNLSASPVGLLCESGPGQAIEMDQDDGPTSWADFLRDSAIYILAARPNSSATHIRLPL